MQGMNKERCYILLDRPARPSRRWLSGWIWILLLSGRVGAVNLGGQEVPREKLIVYLLIGHCNMSGRESNCDTATHPRAWNYQIKDATHTTDAGWILAKPPFHTEGQNNTKCGPGLPILKRLIAKYPADYYFAVLQNADPGATVDGDYRRGKALFNELVAAAKKVQSEATLGGVIAMLDVFEVDQQKAQAFASQMQSMVEELRADLAAADLPLFLCDFQSNSPKYTGHPYKTVIQEQFKQIPQVLSASGLVPYNTAANLFMAGSEHFSRGAYEEWAVALVDRVIVPGADQAWPHPWYPAGSGSGGNPGGPSSTGPKAVIAAAGYAAVNTPVELDGTSSVGTIASYAWTPEPSVTLPGAKVTHTWKKEGKYAVTLTVTDALGKTGTAQAEIEILRDTTPWIAIQSPQGGEDWPPGSRQALRWTAYFLKDVKLFYSTNGGTDWTSIGNVDDTYPNWGNYEWEVPAVFSESCQILIEGYDNEAPTHSGPFRIAGEPGSVATSSRSASDAIGGSCSSKDGSSESGVILLFLLFVFHRRVSRSYVRSAEKGRSS